MNWDAPEVTSIVESFRTFFLDHRRKNAALRPGKHQSPALARWFGQEEAAILKALRPWIKKCGLANDQAKAIVGRIIGHLHTNLGADAAMESIVRYLEEERVRLHKPDRQELADVVRVYEACFTIMFLFSNNSITLVDAEHLQLLDEHPPLHGLDNELVKKLLVYIGLVFREDVEQFRALEPEIEAALAPIRKEFQRRLNAVALNVYPDYATKRAVAVAIQEVADRLGVAFKCPECGEPARLKCVMTGTAKTGVLSFGHSNTTHRGKTTLPALLVVDAAPDKRKVRPELGENLAEGD